MNTVQVMKVVFHVVYVSRGIEGDRFDSADTTSVNLSRFERIIACTAVQRHLRVVFIFSFHIRYNESAVIPIPRALDTDQPLRSNQVLWQRLARS
jgi:hypothetical protein